MPSKLGIHAIMPGETLAVMRQLLAAGAHLRTVKAVSSVGWLREVKGLDPQTVTVGRLMRGTDPGVNVEGPALEGNLRESAQRVMESLLPLWEQHQTYVDYWEIINEQDPVGVDGHRRLAGFMGYCMEIAEREGYHLALFSYSMGVPEWREMEAVAETGVFAQARDGGHALALHEYAYPMDRWFGTPLPGRPTYPDRGPLACRYRWWYEDFLIPRGEVIPLLLTEVNVAHPLPFLSTEEWLAQITWYDRQLRHDRYVVGAHLFTLGSAGSWPEYDFARFLPELIAYMIAEKDVQDDEQIPAPPSPNPPGPGETAPVPRERYSRHYLLLPQNATWRWIAACRRYWETFKVTIGFSADDAAYGPGLTERAVTVINPEAWGDDIEAFFEMYYPGVRYDPVVAETPEELQALLDRRVDLGLRFG